MNEKAYEPELIKDQQTIFDAERKAIQSRRKRLRSSDFNIRSVFKKSIFGKDIRSDIRIKSSLPEDHDLTGLALSGGGIRSAAFSMGAVQALEKHDVMKGLDYLSTVSGGGYFGASFSAANACSHSDELRFTFVANKGQSAEQAADISDTPMVAHIRNYSNFLLRRGVLDLVRSLALILRGIIAGMIIIATYVIGMAAVTVAYNSSSQSLELFGPSALSETSEGMGFPISFVAGILLVITMIAWVIRNSYENFRDTNDIRSNFGTVAAILGGVLVVCGIFEAQTWLLHGMFEPDQVGRNETQGYLTKFLATLLGASPLLLFFVNFFKDQLAKTANEEAGLIHEKLKKYGSRMALFLAAMVLPLIIYLCYLALVYWGISSSTELNAIDAYKHSPTMLQDAFSLSEWLASVLRYFSGTSYHISPSAIFYGVVAVALFALTYSISPNAYSLHGLYRERLADAFLRSPNAIQADLDVKLSALADQKNNAPYHLFNTAINVHGSNKVNERGRNADFFLFSPLFVGSPATGYVATKTMEQSCPSLSLSSVVAISGAAASSNMGAQTMRGLTFTLAALNVRLGYWLPNPRKVAVGGPKEAKDTKPLRFFLWSEMVSGLDERCDQVLLSDGGHIENLAIYELLRRRCRLIIAIDAEADERMRFGSFVTLQRYARIDLGIRIELPWAELAERTRLTMAANADPNTQFPEAHMGPHAALGTISYDDGSKGYLLYVKSSLTGDENDYIRDYARRHPTFPHETTGDQFFSEEQFEVYRALGFHCVNAIFTGRDAVLVRNAEGGSDLMQLKKLLSERGVDTRKMDAA
jgi:predicted acylesterase/phospholipase RssA